MYISDEFTTQWIDHTMNFLTMNLACDKFTDDEFIGLAKKPILALNDTLGIDRLLNKWTKSSETLPLRTVSRCYRMDQLHFYLGVRLPQWDHLVSRYPTLFYLKGAWSQCLRVNCADIALLYLDQIELFILGNNTWNYLTMRKQLNKLFRIR